MLTIENSTPLLQRTRSAFTYIRWGIGIAAAILGWYALHHHQPATESKQAAALRDEHIDKSWYRDVTPMAPTPVPTPRVYPSPTPLTPYLTTSPYQTRHSAAPDSGAQERIRRYQRASSSDLMVKVDRGQTLETPRLLTAQTADRSPIMVDAKPAPPHTISAWTFIYGTLETGIRSDHPGDVIGRVSQDVKDTVTQTETLIPMGSRLHGIQRGAQQVQLNDTSIVVTWDDIEFPNGGHIPISRMPGTDSEGYPGFADLVDRHLAQTWGPAVLVSAITAGTMLASRPTYGGINGYDPTQQVAGSFGQTLGTRAVSGLNSEAMQNKPTITIREGYTFRVLVTRDMVFSGPYAQ